MIITDVVDDCEVTIKGTCYDMQRYLNKYAETLGWNIGDNIDPFEGCEDYAESIRIFEAAVLKVYLDNDQPGNSPKIKAVRYIGDRFPKMSLIVRGDTVDMIVHKFEKILKEKP